MTNYDRIKAMSVDELADFICGIYDEEDDDAKFINGITIPYYNENDIKEWLDREVEREMTDTEIVNALQHCITGNCEGCPYEKYCDEGENKLLRDAQSRIFSLKAEIENLKTDVADNTETLATVRYEAIKEFADKLKEFAYTAPNWTSSVLVRVVDIEDMYNLVEEMIGGDKK